MNNPMPTTTSHAYMIDGEIRCGHHVFNPSDDERIEDRDNVIFAHESCNVCGRYFI
jgi:hypothetical protein